LRHLRHFRNYVDPEKPFPEPRRDHAGIAAVVAGASEHQDVLALVAGQRRSERGRRRAGPFHQRGLGLPGGAFDAPNVVAQVDRTMHP